jgi:CBS domain-containing protein
MSAGTAGEIMTPIVHSVKAATPVEDVARLMRRQHIHRVIVERNRNVVGLISVLDLVAVVFSGPSHRKRSTKKK